jgi:hypothetical protein
MGAPFATTAISGYNANPPIDDGTQTEANRVKWSTIKTKLPDTIKTAYEASETATLAAFAKVIGGGGITSTGVSYQVLSTDQGKLIRATAAGITITTPDATDVDDPFVFGVRNDSAGNITLDGSGAQTVNGSANLTIPAKQGLLLFTDGSNWFSVGFFDPAGDFTAANVTATSAVTGATVTASGALSGTTAAGAMIASVAEQEAGAATNKVVTPGTQHRHASAAKGWVELDSVATAVLSYNVSSVTDGGAGTFTVNWGTDFSTANHCDQATPVFTPAGTNISTFVAQISNTKAAGTTQVLTLRLNDFSAQDTSLLDVAAFGDHA